MSLGTSIFLSAILLGIVALFIATKDRWNWKKVLLWPVALFTILAVVISAGIYIYSFISERPRSQTVFWDIPIDATRSDVKYLKGDPTKKEGNDIWEYVPDRDSYSKEISILFIRFNGDNLRAIIYTGPALTSPGIQGLDIGSTQEAVTEKFGTPSYISVSDDDLNRMLSFERFNTYFVFEKNKVVAFGMFNPKYGPMRFEKEKNITEKKL